jgi:hypothetical protein
MSGASFLLDLDAFLVRGGGALDVLDCGGPKGDGPGGEGPVSGGPEKDGALYDCWGGFWYC